jgi:hypothetical protein
MRRQPAQSLRVTPGGLADELLHLQRRPEPAGIVRAEARHVGGAREVLPVRAEHVAEQGQAV